MCLIDAVEFWDSHRIECLATSHLDEKNPLRAGGELGSIHLLEYGAQAMAIHNGLLKRCSTRGVLAALRNVRLYVDRLESLKDPLRISAIAEGNSFNTAVYGFEVRAFEGTLLVAARATVIAR